VLRGKQVRLIANDNEQVGIVPLDEALARAEESGLDLVEVAPNATPPVCRIMNFGKFQYTESRKQRQGRKKGQQHKLKEIKFHPNIDKHDYETKLGHAIAFLEKGYKVKVSMFFRGREMAHRELGMELMKRVCQDVAEHASIETPARMQGRSIIMFLAPGKAAT
jgi:translation initiation factor IF-3